MLNWANGASWILSNLSRQRVTTGHRGLSVRFGLFPDSQKRLRRRRALTVDSKRNDSEGDSVFYVSQRLLNVLGSWTEFSAEERPASPGKVLGSYMAGMTTKVCYRMNVVG